MALCRENVMMMVKSKNSSTAASTRGRITSALEAKSFSELHDYMLSEHHIALSSLLSTIPLESVQKACEGIEQVLAVFPETANWVDTLAYRDGGGGVLASNHGNGSIYLRGFFSYLPNILSYKDRSLGGDAATITAHEMGHTLEIALIRTAIARGDIVGAYSDAWNSGTMSTRIIGEARKRAHKTEWGRGMKDRALKASISGYATTSNQEALAEAVADYVTNGQYASPFSIEVVTTAQDYLRGR